MLDAHRNYILSVDPAKQESLRRAYTEATHNGNVVGHGSMVKAIILTGDARLLKKYLAETGLELVLTGEESPYRVCIVNELLLSLKRLDVAPVEAIRFHCHRDDLIEFLLSAASKLAEQRGTQRCIAGLVVSVLNDGFCDWTIKAIYKVCNRGYARLLQDYEFPTTMSRIDVTELYNTAKHMNNETVLSPPAAIFTYKLARYLVVCTEYGFRCEKEIELLQSLARRCTDNPALVYVNGTPAPLYELPNNGTEEYKILRLQYHHEVNLRSLSGLNTLFILRVLEDDNLDMALVVTSERAGPDDSWFPLFLDLMACGADTSYLEGLAVRNVLKFGARPDLVAAVIDLLEENFLTNQSIVENLKDATPTIDTLLTKRMERLLITV